MKHSILILLTKPLVMFCYGGAAIRGTARTSAETRTVGGRSSRRG
jgi:hypothetical protein